MVMGERRKGLKVTYTTDTRPVQAIVKQQQEPICLFAKAVWRT